MSEFIFTDKFKKLSLPFKTTFDRMQRRKKIYDIMTAPIELLLVFRSSLVFKSLTY